MEWGSSNLFSRLPLKMIQLDEMRATSYVCPALESYISLWLSKDLDSSTVRDSRRLENVTELFLQQPPPRQ